MNRVKSLNQKKIRRKNRARAGIFGVAAKPRFSVFRSNKYDYVQLIDDLNGKTLVAAAVTEIKNGKKTKTDKARALGELIAKKALEKGIREAVSDRGGCRFHGRVKAVVEGARSGGLKL
ncbi:MAG: 50S ribosomal protein L18 [Parcubacteria group bacterium]|nr:50S ribosomal protein L18 [Parcubacteria group bacterium]